MFRLLSLIVGVMGIAGCLNQDGQVRKKKTEAEYRELEATLKADLVKSRTTKSEPIKDFELPAIAK